MQIIARNHPAKTTEDELKQNGISTPKQVLRDLVILGVLGPEMEPNAKLLSIRANAYKINHLADNIIANCYPNMLENDNKLISFEKAQLLMQEITKGMSVFQAAWNTFAYLCFKSNYKLPEGYAQPMEKHRAPEITATSEGGTKEPVQVTIEEEETPPPQNVEKPMQANLVCLAAEEIQKEPPQKEMPKNLKQLIALLPERGTTITPDVRIGIIHMMTLALDADYPATAP